MAKKPGPKKGSKQRRKNGPRTQAAPASPARNGGSTDSSARGAERRQASAMPSQETKKQSAGSRLGALFNSPAVRKVMAATLVSAAGALLFNKRGGDRAKEPAVHDQDTSISSTPASDTTKRGGRRTGAGPRKPGARSSGPASDDADPLVAAGVAGELGNKKQAAGSTPKRRGAKPRAQTPTSLAEPSTTEAGPGAYPDGSPVGDTAGRTSVEGGSGDHIQ